MAASLAIGITSAPRPENYFDSSLASLRATGFDQHVHVFCEPGILIEPQVNLTVHQSPDQLGCYRNWRRGFEWLAANSATDWIAMLQDDAVWCTNAAVEIAATLENRDYAGVGMLSPYTSPAMVPTEICSGWVDANFQAMGFWGAVALLIPRSSVEALLTCSIFTEHTHHRKLDNVLGAAFRSLELRVLVHVPSLVDHIGAISTLGRHTIASIQWGRRGYRFEETR